MKSDLEKRNYRPHIVDIAIEKTKNINRTSALKKKNNNKKQSDRPVFAVAYDPRLPAIQSSMAKHWRSMVAQDQYLRKVFPMPPLTGFKRNQNIRNHLIRAQLPKSKGRYPKRILKGMTKCGTGCTACPFIMEGKSIQFNKNEDWKINKPVNCNSYNVVYLIECSKSECKMRYIGETKRMLGSRLADHWGYIKNQDTDKVTGAHFNLPGHDLSNLKITVLEIPKKMDDQYRKQRERYLINKFNTKHQGLNKKN